MPIIVFTVMWALNWHATVCRAGLALMLLKSFCKQRLMETKVNRFLKKNVILTGQSSFFVGMCGDSMATRWNTRCAPGPAAVCKAASPHSQQHPHNGDRMVPSSPSPCSTWLLQGMAAAPRVARMARKSLWYFLSPGLHSHRSNIKPAALSERQRILSDAFWEWFIY